LTLAVALVAAAPGSAAAQDAGCSYTATAASAASEAILRDAVRCVVNATRAQHGLPALQRSERLAAAAERHSADMVRDRYFAHVSPGGRSVADRVRHTGYLSGAGDWTLGEDIGWGTGALGTPAAIVQGWMNSPGHRAVMLGRRYHEVGVGVARGVPPRRRRGQRERRDLRARRRHGPVAPSPARPTGAHALLTSLRRFLAPPPLVGRP
jgi:uncharacterized protein YkwD